MCLNTYLARLFQTLSTLNVILYKKNDSLSLVHAKMPRYKILNLENFRQKMRIFPNEIVKKYKENLKVLVCIFNDLDLISPG